jgi:acyl-CoA thioesterase FadM
MSVCVDQETHKAVPLPDDVREKVLAFMRG